MAEGEDNLKVRFYCVCGHCNHHDSTPGVEINFLQESIFYKCSKCGKMNKMEVKSVLHKPYPSSRTGLR